MVKDGVTVEVSPSDGLIKGPLGAWWLAGFSHRPGEIFRLQNELTSRLALRSPEELMEGARESHYNAKGFGKSTTTTRNT